VVPEDDGGEGEGGHGLLQRPLQELALRRVVDYSRWEQLVKIMKSLTFS
jgi:hypothetical protein